MEIELLNAILIAEKYTGQDSIEDKIKKLGEEVAEFTIAALTSENPDEVFDEGSDVLFVMMHIASKKIPLDRLDMSKMIKHASEKLKSRCTDTSVKDTYFSCCGNQERKGHKPWCRKK